MEGDAGIRSRTSRGRCTDVKTITEKFGGLSFDQEQVTKWYGQFNPQTPHYFTLLQDQFKIKDNFKIVGQDTLKF